MSANTNIKSTTESASPSSPEKVEDGTVHAVNIDPVLEKKILRKFDMLVMPQFVIIILLAYLDRSNIGNARIFGFEEDLGLVGNQFANVSSFFYVTYVIFEVPWVLAVKKFGANSVAAVAIVLWSAITLATGFVKNYGQTIAMRLLLGFAEAGIFPALVFVISTIYPRESQGKRVAVMYAASALSGAFGGLIAYGIQLMGDRHGLSAWRWLFIVEGTISFVLGAACWATLPKSAEHAWFLGPAERQLMEDKRRRDFIYKGESKLSWADVRLAFTDPIVIMAGVCLFCASIPLFGFGIFLPTIISGLGFKSIQVNYLTIPVYIFGCLYLALMTYLSDRLRKRAIFMVCATSIVVIGYAIAIGSSSVGAGYFAMFLVAGVYQYNCLLLTWVSNNITPDSKRSAAIPWFTCIGNISGVVASQVYPSSTGPRYIMGNAISMAMEVSAILGAGVIWFMLYRRTQQKKKLIAEGVVDNGKKGDKALDFEYIY